jgi:hypothetical protein
VTVRYVFVCQHVLGLRIFLDGFSLPCRYPQDSINDGSASAVYRRETYDQASLASILIEWCP